MHDVLLRDTDQMSMAHALEVRVPLLDHKLVEYVMGAPDAYKRPNGVPKSLLVRTSATCCPMTWFTAPSKGLLCLSRTGCGAIYVVFARNVWIRGALGAEASLTSAK